MNNKIEFLNSYNKTFNEITSNYKEATSGIGYIFVPIILVVGIIPLFEVIEIISAEYKVVIIIYLLFVSGFIATTIALKNMLKFIDRKYYYICFFILMLLYATVNPALQNILPLKLNVDVEVVKNISIGTILFFALFITIYFIANSTKMESGYANIHYKTSIICLNYIFSNKEDINDFNYKCALIEKMSMFNDRVGQAYSIDEIEEITAILNAVKNNLDNKRKSHFTIKYIEWLTKEIKAQQVLL